MDGDQAIAVAGGVALVLCAANWWSRAPVRKSADARLELVTKPLATIAIAAVAVASAKAGADAPAAALILGLVGFALCLGGDIALLPAVDKFVVGLASFLLGHLAFVAMFVALGLDEPWLALPALAFVGVIAATVGSRILAGAARESAALVWPVRAYLAVISSMAVVGWATGRPAAIVGSTLFVVSDSILGWGKFVANRRWMSVAVMVTYHGALGGLALSLR